MAHVNKVVRSYETEDGRRCVDIFCRPDGSFGFEEYRRDPEDPRGWQSARGFETSKFPSQSQCTTAAMDAVAWLKILADPQPH